MRQICTTVEQSKKLVELGIDANTADMHYTFAEDFSMYILYADNEVAYCSERLLPAWSLSALLKLMPKLYEFENYPDDGGCQPNLCKGWDNNQWHIVYRSSIYITEWYDEPIDAAFEMICWLKENNKL